MNYSIHTKVNWNQKNTLGWEKAFYPSLVKKVKKSDGYFKENFYIEITDLDSIHKASNFFKLYNKEIVSRGNYLYPPGYQQKLLEGRIKEGKKYIQVIIIEKGTQKHAGGIIMRINEDQLIFSLRAIDSNSRSYYRSATTLDFWIEKEIYEYARSQNFSYLSHGTDSYPNKGRIGLVLFKLKVGVKPKISPKEHEILNLTEDDIKAFNTPTFFWDNPDENNFFRDAHLFYKKSEVDESVLSELVKVLNWTGIQFEQVEL